jgi:microcystin-dependent protein
MTKPENLRRLAAMAVAVVGVFVAYTFAQPDNSSDKKEEARISREEGRITLAPPIFPPIGSIQAYAGPVSEDWEKQNGWMLCNGRSLDQNSFKLLHDAIGDSWGGDKVKNFNIPDLGGRFLRGTDSGKELRDPDRNDRVPCDKGGNKGNSVGSVQDDKLQTHIHNDGPGHSHGASVSLPKWQEEWADDSHENKVNGNEGNQGDQGDQKFSVSVDNAHVQIGPPETAAGMPDVRHGKETRPVNAYVTWIIRVR